MKRFFLTRRQGSDRPVKSIVLVKPDRAKAPSCRAEIFRERVDQNGVLRHDRRKRLETVHECAIDIIGQEDQIFATRPDQFRDLFHRLLLHADGCGIRRVHQKERLHRRVRELFDL
jgi:hypothetical protein